MQLFFFVNLKFCQNVFTMEYALKASIDNYWSNELAADLLKWRI